jgi:hypothetical protein
MKIQNDKNKRGYEGPQTAIEFSPGEYLSNTEAMTKPILLQNWKFRISDGTLTRLSEISMQN